MSSGSRKNKDPYTQQVIEALHDRFPKFTNVQMSLIRNPAYGLQMASEAQEVLKAKGIPPPSKTTQKKNLNAPKRTRNERVSVRLTSDEKVRFLELIKSSGCKTVQEYITNLIKENER
jgi:hypothetical protein